MVYLLKPPFIDDYLSKDADVPSQAVAAMAPCASSAKSAMLPTLHVASLVSNCPAQAWQRLESTPAMGQTGSTRCNQIFPVASLIQSLFPFNGPWIKNWKNYEISSAFHHFSMGPSLGPAWPHLFASCAPAAWGPLPLQPHVLGSAWAVQQIGGSPTKIPWIGGKIFTKNHIGGSPTKIPWIGGKIFTKNHIGGSPTKIPWIGGKIFTKNHIGGSPAKIPWIGGKIFTKNHGFYSFYPCKNLRAFL